MWTVDQAGPVMPVAPNLRRADEEDALLEWARREVTSLYLERAAEFRNYAISLVHDEELALDALQEAFMRYFAALCDGARIHAPRAWVYRVMHNYLSDRQKEYRVRNETSIDYISTRLCQKENPERKCLHRELWGLVRNTLTAREYACFRLRSDGLRYDEIAATLRVRSGTVGALLSRAVRKMRVVLGLAEGDASWAGF
jgi:RNA polymerase sigma factor (sigma-70 family)